MNPSTSPDSLPQARQYVSTRRERLGWRLFPSTHLDIPDKPGMRDVLVTNVTIEVSFLDRLRLLVSGRARCEIKTATENVIGSHATASNFNVSPPSWLSR